MDLFYRLCLWVLYLSGNVGLRALLKGPTAIVVLLNRMSVTVMLEILLMCEQKQEESALQLALFPPPFPETKDHDRDTEAEDGDSGEGNGALSSTVSRGVRGSSSVSVHGALTHGHSVLKKWA
ncbi:hypothetical protein JZ751_019545 [Albula glossodonta]|uniref:Uncharacterized protein n=1 Tax=Albula glossodonta TaxID=121402 RepID=A0A8T2N065_9TELE|nr:hypothetical protein JZ751_019545 [Albula glossodonta]